METTSKNIKSKDSKIVEKPAIEVAVEEERKGAKNEEEKIRKEIKEDKIAATPAKVVPPTKAVVIKQIEVKDHKGPLFTFNVWFNLRKFKKHWEKPMQLYATDKKVIMATMIEWDELFSNY